MPRSMFKTLKEKVMGTITAHPKLLTLGIGLAVTFVIGTAMGLVDHSLAFASALNFGNTGCAFSRC